MISYYVFASNREYSRLPVIDQDVLHCKYISEILFLYENLHK